MTTHGEDALEQVRERYAAVAASELSGSSEAARAIASAFGYSQDELGQLPDEANMGLSCGHPVALAGLRAGEVVLDLGCGGGLDVFLAARRVGDTGQVIGVDMTAEMLARAREGARKLGLSNVTFLEATIDRLPLEDASVDCIISNCVINLAPDKSAVFREIFRVLRPGGRVAISDIALRKALPEAVRRSVEAYVGCIGGAVLLDEYRALLERAGLESVRIDPTGADLGAYAAAGGACCGSEGEEAASRSETPTVHEGLASALASFDVSSFATSVRVHALKPATPGGARETDPSHEEAVMRTIRVYDRPLCCSTGVCGPDVDPALPRFAADLEWLVESGHRVDRFNLAQQPQAFVENETVHRLISTHGTDCLPLILVDGNVVSRGDYPGRELLAKWVAEPTPVGEPLRADDGGECCRGSGCC